MKRPELIVMLTDNDLTSPDSVEIFTAAKDAPAMCWGFKDVGIDEKAMSELHKHMKDAGKKTYLEIIKEDEDGLRRSFEFAAQEGFDAILHAKYRPEWFEITKQAGIEYMPSLGKHVNHRLTGTIDAMVEEAKELDRLGLYGYKLSAYRYIEGDSTELLHSVLGGVKSHSCVTGSINDYARLDSLVENGVEMFTVGSAFFAGKFGGTFSEQITNVVNHLNK